MISYKSWKTMNENFDSKFATLFSNPPTVGIVGASEFGLEEAKKKKCDNSDMDDTGTKEKGDAETGDGEIVDAASDKDKSKEKGKPPWLNKKKEEAKDDGGCNPEGDQAGKVIPWLNRKGNHGALNKKTAQEKLSKLTDKVSKESSEAVEDLFFATLRDQIGTPRSRNNGGLDEEALIAPSNPIDPADPENIVGTAPTGRIFQLAGMADEDGNSLIPTLESVKKK